MLPKRCQANASSDSWESHVDHFYALNLKEGFREVQTCNAVVGLWTSNVVLHISNHHSVTKW